MWAMRPLGGSKRYNSGDLGPAEESFGLVVMTEPHKGMVWRKCRGEQSGHMRQTPVMRGF